jgi:hypothetical protein
MRGAILYGPGDVRFEERPDPRIIESTDAILRIAATCVCGSDLRPYRGIDSPAHALPGTIARGLFRSVDIRSLIFVCFIFVCLIFVCQH